ncbi:MAG: PilZ domain-containing protein [Acidimicrobiia bacterium]|nr:PilZ domain-containing protein [Acidimicrobiia bacterium]
MDDKRDAERIPILGELQGEMMVFQPMHVKDISLRGASVETRYPLQLNSLHDVRLVVGNKSVILKGRVVHSRISDVDQDIVTYKTGLEFLDVSDRQAAAINEFLESLKANRSGV